MTQKSVELISDFQATGWKTPRLYERLFELTEQTHEIGSFAQRFLSTFQKSATIFKDALSYISRDQFTELIQQALAILVYEENENAEDLIHSASLQFPELLRDHLPLIFELQPNRHSYYASYPWRGLTTNEISPFKATLLDPETSLDDRVWLFKSLLATRDFATVKFAVQYACNSALFGEKEIGVRLVGELELVGFTVRNGIIERFCMDHVRHFAFPKNYFSAVRPIHLNKERHPTWNLRSDNRFAFGGILGDTTENVFAHLLTLDDSLSGTGVSGFSTVTFGVHLSDLNDFQELFYQHDGDGQPNRIGTVDKPSNYDSFPIKSTLIGLAETPDRWRIQDWASSNSRENIFRLGGEPSWIQNAEVLRCPSCGEKMNFLMQLDSELPDMEGGEVYFGSGGICYAFWCDTDKISGFMIQCT